tara:strand:- start:1345 stop:1680 length:336 start_codon:yes stop_codon:yes gene_type:complete
MGKFTQYNVAKQGTPVIVSGRTRFSLAENFKRVPVVFAYEQSQLPFFTGFGQIQRWFRINGSPLESSLGIEMADYYFPEGTLLWFCIDPFEKAVDTVLTVHTKIGEKGEGY